MQCIAASIPGSGCGGEAASVSSCGAEGIAAAPPDGCDRKAGMAAAALDGASDSCPELALAELAADAFLINVYGRQLDFMFRDVQIAHDMIAQHLIPLYHSVAGMQAN